MMRRRSFIQVMAAAGGGLLLGVAFPRKRALAQGADKKVFAPNAFVRIGTDGIVTILVGKSEMGQGVATSLPMLVNEELGADWSKIKMEFAPEDKAYYVFFAPNVGFQLTGGSMSVKSSYDSLREAGAVARELLVAAAAQKWKVKPEQCKVDKGMITGPGGKKISFGDIATDAAALPVPKDKPKLKAKMSLVGKPTARLDTPDKCTGKAVFGIDVKVPDMLVARVVRCPVFGGKVKSFDGSKAKAVPGVKHVVQTSMGVAVIATGFWPASQGVKALDIKWDEGKLANASSEGFRKDWEARLAKPGAKVRADGDAEGALKGADKVIEAIYEAPYLAHATMEPMNATAHVRKDGVDVWAPTQAQTFSRQAAAKMSGVPIDKVNIHTTYLGGGFGRRAEVDFVLDAVECSKAAGVPVKVIWTREDDMQHDFYRPASLVKLRAGLKGGKLVAMHARIVSPSIMMGHFPMFVQNGVDASSVEGIGDSPYAIANFGVDYHLVDVGVPVGFWRSVGHSQNGFFFEAFLDEVAKAMGADPLAMRKELLEKAPRHKAVLELAANKFGWTKSLPSGHFKGLAVRESFGTYVAECAEVSIEGGAPKVHRIVAAVDCGRVVNPDTVQAQIMSGIIYGMSAALYGEITLEKGRVKQRNFNDYPMVRLAEAPKIDVHIVPSDQPASGCGEPGVPPFAPAVANALLSAGKPIRKLPIRIPS
jgi:isoquinoline 1-oxidoreductase beta subunit